MEQYMFFYHSILSPNVVVDKLGSFWTIYELESSYIHKSELLESQLKLAFEAYYECLVDGLVELNYLLCSGQKELDSPLLSSFVQFSHFFLELTV